MTLPGEAGALLESAIPLFKKCLDQADRSPLEAWLDALSPEKRAQLAPPLGEFLAAERARLVKLRTLGLRQGAGERLRMIDELIARLRRERDLAGGENA